MSAHSRHPVGSVPETLLVERHAAGYWATLATSAAFDRLCTVLGILGIVALTVRRWELIGPYPPGLDGAQWLAIGRGFHGVGRSTDGAYAPLTPLLATLLDAAVGPLPGLRLLAVLSGLAVSLAVWLVARAALGPRWGLLAAALAVPASALAEPLLYGAYPQQLALAAGISGLWFACRFLVSGARRTLLLCAAAALVAAAAHHIFFPLMIFSIGFVTIMWFDTRPAAAQSHLRALTLALVPAGAVFAAVAASFISHGYVAPLAASARAAPEAWQYGTREAPVAWAAIVLVAVLSLALMWRQRSTAAWILAAGLLMPAGLLFLISGQPRLLPPVIVGGAIAATFGLSQLSRAAGERPRPVLPLVLAAIAVILLVHADRAAGSFADFYRVVDEPLLQAAAAIDADGARGAVAVRQDRRGWPIGWWFEALQERPVLTGSDARWLGYPDERSRALQAAALFDGQLDAAGLRTRAATSDVRYLVAPKWEWIGWERWLTDPAFPVTIVSDDDRYIVLRVE